MADDPTPEPQPPARNPWRRRWIFAATLCVWVLWVIGQIARDATWVTGICFYIPSPVMTGLVVVAVALHALQRDRRLTLILGLMTLPPAFAVLLLENQWVRPVSTVMAPHAPHTRLIHWNIAYGRWGIEHMEEELFRRNAEVYVLSEVPRPYALSDLAARLGSGFDSVRLGSMAFVARGRLVAPERLVNTERLKVNRVTWQREDGTFTLFGVDLTSDLLVARDPLLRQMRTLMEQHRPDIVAGDFNAPRRSRAIWPLPWGYSHAYHAAGHGWSYTWPVPCPLYALDQCIVSPNIRPRKYELISLPSSDHRMQILEFLPGPAAP